MQQERHEDALQNLLWFHEHALEQNPALAGVRLSFALAAWIELGEKYPKALQALTSIRDEKTKVIIDGQGSFPLFLDVAAMNEYLKESPRTVALFKVIHQTYPDLARQCYGVAEPQLVAHREHGTCACYVPDAPARFEEIRQLFQMKMQIADENPALREGGVPEYAEASFVAEVCRLIEILVGVGRGQEAEKIRELAQPMIASAEARDALAKAPGHQEPGP
jgi:hypothetical protein